MKGVLPSQVSMPPTMVGLTAISRFLIWPPRLNHSSLLPIGRDIFLFAMYEVG
jgi:hypothetical protein